MSFKFETNLRPFDGSGSWSLWVRRTLAENGFPTKEPVAVGGEQAAKVLGLSVVRRGSEIYWQRKSELNIEELREQVSDLSEIAGAIGQIAPNHYPVQSWLRPYANEIRSQIGAEAAHDRWKLKPSATLLHNFNQLLDRLQTNDPVGGPWDVPLNGHFELWTDASKNATGHVIQIDGKTLEDSSTRSIGGHINVRELNAVVQCLTRLYQIRKVSGYRKQKFKATLYCDNKSVVSWIRSILFDLPIRLKTMSYVLVDNRLQILKEILSVLNVDLEVRYVKSAMNKADELTRWEKEKGIVATVANRALDPATIATSMKALHEELLHKGPEIVAAEFRKRYAGPGSTWSNSEIRKAAVEVCNECRRTGACLYKSPVRVERSAPKGKCHQARAIGDEVFIDFLKVDPGERSRFTGAFNLIDAYSRKLMCFLVDTAPTSELARTAIMQWISLHGDITVIRCDQGTEFSRIIAEGAELRVGQSRKGAVLHPQSQGLLERCHRELLSCIRTQAVGAKRRIPWHERYLEAVRVWNSRPHKVLGWNSPVEVWEGADVPSDAEEEEEEDIVDERGREADFGLKRP